MAQRKWDRGKRGGRGKQRVTCPLSQDSEDMENAEDEVGSRASHVDISRQYLRCEGGGRSEEPVRG